MATATPSTAPRMAQAMISFFERHTPPKTACGIDQRLPERRLPRCRIGLRIVWRSASSWFNPFVIVGRRGARCRGTAGWGGRAPACLVERISSARRAGTTGSAAHWANVSVSGAGVLLAGGFGR